MVITGLQTHSNPVQSSTSVHDKKGGNESTSFEEMMERSLRKNKAKKSTKSQHDSKSKRANSHDHRDDDRVENHRKDRPEKKVGSQRRMERPAGQAIDGIKHRFSSGREVQNIESKGELQGLQKGEAIKSLEQDVLFDKAETIQNDEFFKKLSELQEQKPALSKIQSEQLQKTLQNLKNKGQKIQELDLKSAESNKTLEESINNVTKKIDLKIGSTIQQPKLTTGENNKGSVETPVTEVMEDLGLANSKITAQMGKDKDFSEQDTLQFKSTVNMLQDPDMGVDNSDPETFIGKLNEAEGKQNPNQKIENMESIIKQARTFIKDGGGSMFIEMTPKGLGKLQLNVNVQDGQVNVEMFADNKFAKAALEDGMAEMKAALESHRLVVDNLKVEMAQDFEKDFTDLRQQMQEFENREFAREFLGQFHDERDQKFGSMVQGITSRLRGSNAMEPQLQAQRAYFGDGKGQSINLVA